MEIAILLIGILILSIIGVVIWRKMTRPKDVTSLIREVKGLKTRHEQLRESLSKTEDKEAKDD